MKKIFVLSAFLIVFLLGLAQPASAACEMNRPIMFAGLDWQSNHFHVEVARFIMEKGYGCETDSIPGSTIPLLQGMIRGDVDVTMEMWKDNVKEAFQKGVDAGKIVELGINFPDAVQGWFVPRYLVEGSGAKAPGLKRVTDLPKYKKLFSDPEEPEKGRFLNCILGWGCEVINTNKLVAYGLLNDYTNFRPGTGAALAAAIASNYQRKKPFVAYYWGPTWVLGKYDLVMLEEDPFNQKVWDELAKTKGKNGKAVAYPVVAVSIATTTQFTKDAPKLTAFLKNYRTSNKQVSQALVYLQEKKGSKAKDAALEFLRTKQDVWTKWVPADVASRVNAAL